MRQPILRTVMAACCWLLMASQSAQAQGTLSNGTGPRRQVATIIYSGLGGAVLGLSTLSFYGRPQEKLANIAIGFAFGIIAGTTYVTYQAATSRNDYYTQNRLAEETLQIASRTRHDSHRDESLAKFQYQWSF